MLLIEQHKSGFERPADLEFEDYTQGIKPATSDSSLNPPKVRAKLWPFNKKHKVSCCTSDICLLPLPSLLFGFCIRQLENHLILQRVIRANNHLPRLSYF